MKQRIGVVTGKRADGTEAIQQVEMSFIPESDLYRLIAKSQLEGAVEFEKWVFEDVLPSIRKHGAYLAPNKLYEIKKFSHFESCHIGWAFLKAI